MQYIPSERVVQCDAAIRHVGTNAIPYLLTWVRYETPGWKIALYKAINPLLTTLKSSWRLSDEQHIRRANGAAYGLKALGVEAEGTIPDLTLILNDARASASAQRAANVLGGLGTKGLQPILVVLTNRQANLELRYFLAGEIEMVQTNRAAIPALQALLSDYDLRMRRFATNAIQSLNPKAL